MALNVHGRTHGFMISSLEGMGKLDCTDNWCRVQAQALPVRSLQSLKPRTLQRTLLSFFCFVCFWKESAQKKKISIIQYVSICVYIFPLLCTCTCSSLERSVEELALLAWLGAQGHRLPTWPLAKALGTRFCLSRCIILGSRNAQMPTV